MISPSDPAARARAAEAREATVSLCKQLGLRALADNLDAAIADSHHERRRSFLEIREQATGIIEAGRIQDPERILVLELETEAAKGIAACDEIIKERDADRAATRNGRPILPTSRRMQLNRGGDDRR